MGFGRTGTEVDGDGVLGSLEVLHWRERRCIRIAMGSVSTPSCASHHSMAHSGLCHCMLRRPYAGPFLPTILQLDARYLVLPLRLHAPRLFSPRHHYTLQSERAPPQLCRESLRGQKCAQIFLCSSFGMLSLDDRQVTSRTYSPSAPQETPARRYFSPRSRGTTAWTRCPAPRNPYVGHR